MSEQFEKILKTKVNKLTVTQEWPLRTADTIDKSLVISCGGDGTYLRTSSMIPNSSIPLLGINTDPGRSLGILCSKFLYKERSSDKQIEKIFMQLE
jgi:NAD kinase